MKILRMQLLKFISTHCVQPQPRAVIKLCGDGTNVPYYPTPHIIEGAIDDFWGFEETLFVEIVTIFPHIVSAKIILLSNLQIVASSNSCRNISIFYLIN